MLTEPVHIVLLLICLTVTVPNAKDEVKRVQRKPTVGKTNKLYEVSQMHLYLAIYLTCSVVSIHMYVYCIVLNVFY